MDDDDDKNGYVEIGKANKRVEINSFSDNLLINGFL